MRNLGLAVMRLIPACLSLTIMPARTTHQIIQVSTSRAIRLPTARECGLKGRKHSTTTSKHTLASLLPIKLISPSPIVSQKGALYRLEAASIVEDSTVPNTILLLERHHPDQIRFTDRAREDHEPSMALPNWTGDCKAFILLSRHKHTCMEEVHSRDSILRIHMITLHLAPTGLELYRMAIP